MILSTIYSNPIYIPLCWAMTPIIMMSSMVQVPNGILGKEKRFKEISIRLLLSGILGAIFGITAAFLHAGVYAMVLVYVVTDLTSFLLT
ncbi:oligosaccharide flippase family protein, partial [Salmonella enterica]|uniref:oligosaccharide flippase family protein n=1 Tax=Salmonella enterica TaxID=28901 RepID=UPI002815F8D9